MWVDGQHGSGRTGNQHELRMLMKRTAVTATLPLLIIWWRVWRLRSVINSPLFRRRPGRDGGWRMEDGRWRRFPVFVLKLQFVFHDR